MSGRHDPEELGAHALGLLDNAQARAVEQHLTGCPTCRREWEELREMTDLLDGMPPEAFLDGPPDGDLVLQRTLRQMRAERGADRRRRRVGLVAAAAVAFAALVGGGIVVGRATAPGSDAVPGAVAAPPGTRTADGRQGAVAMSATVTPAAGWVRVAATVRGVPAGAECTLVVVAKDGSESVAGSWLASPRAETAGVTIDGSAAVAPADVLAVAVRDEAGTDLITLRL